MDNTTLVTLSGQLANYQAMDIIANNLANMSTAGFKREAPQFEQYMAQLQADPGQPSPAPLSFVQSNGILRDLSEGPLQKTGNPFDLAISGKGYFQVQTPNGPRFTRDGHFSLNQDGVIVDGSGYPLIGDGGPITVTADDGSVNIGPDGTVSGKQGQIGTVKLVDFTNPGAMTKEGDGLYTTTEQPQPASSGTILQGMIEGSNVQPLAEMSRMIEIMRAYQANAALTQSQQQLMTSSIDKLGTIQQ